MKHLITTAAAITLSAAIISGAAHARSAATDCDLIVAPGSNYLTCATGSIRATAWVPEDRNEQFGDEPEAAPEPEPEPETGEGEGDGETTN